MFGVFVSFTLSQAGMVVRWRRIRGIGWRSSAAVNGVGAAVTFTVLIVVAVTKAREGAWIILLLIPVLVAIFRAMHAHYTSVAAQLSLGTGPPDALPTHNIVIVPISGMHRAVVRAVNYARMISNDVRAVYVDADPAGIDQVQREWQRYEAGVPLVVLPSPYRSVLEPLVDYIQRARAQRPCSYVTIVLPEFVPARWWQHLLHNQRALLMKGALLFEPDTIVTSVPFHLAK
jgi:hypothetical protein